MHGRPWWAPQQCANGLRGASDVAECMQGMAWSSDLPVPTIIGVREASASLSSRVDMSGLVGVWVYFASLVGAPGLVHFFRRICDLRSIFRYLFVLV